MAAPIDLRNDFDRDCGASRRGPGTRRQSHRLLALAEVSMVASRTDASRIGGVGLQIIRDVGASFNSPADRTGHRPMGSHRAHPRSSTP